MGHDVFNATTTVRHRSVDVQFRVGSLTVMATRQKRSETWRFLVLGPLPSPRGVRPIRASGWWSRAGLRLDQGGLDAATLPQLTAALLTACPC